MAEHTTPITEEFLEQIIKKEEETIRKVLGNEGERLDRLENELGSIPLAGTALSQVPMLFEMVKAYSDGSYTEPPLGTIVSIVAALLYIVSPLDLIPDATLVGFADDMALLLFVANKVNDDVEAFRDWKEKNK